MSQNRRARHTDDKFMVRMPGDLRARIKSHADATAQSMNTVVIVALEAAYPAPAIPDKVNQRLLRAALVLAGQWSAALESMGVDPNHHPALEKFHQEAQEAMEAEDK